MSRFLETVASEVPGVDDYPALYRWSVEEPAAFWRSLWRYYEPTCSQKATSTLEIEAGEMRGARWFPGARLNFAENLLRHRDDRPALVWWGEEGRGGDLSYRELYGQVARMACVFADFGVVPGDRVAGFLPNRPETVVAMLAAASLGAVWSSCSPDFGTQGVLDRFGQIRPKILLAADGYRFGGKSFDSLAKVREVRSAIPEIERLVIVPNLAADPELAANELLWPDLLEAAVEAPEIPFAQLPFDHPLYIMYSSGTTGLPKCMVHGAGGTLLQHVKELMLHTDLQRGDRIFYFTTCGWMMWNWLVSSLAVGATVVLYDGSPLKPDAGILFDMAAAERLSVFGCSAKYLALIEKEGLRPAEGRDLSSLRAVLSTGSPLLPENYDYVYREIGDDLQLSSISGGTDLISCFALGNPIAPVYRGELQTLGLGMKVEIFDGDGQPRGAGEAGELVCTAPFPSMPVAFWDDPEGEKYRRAYFDVFPGVWRHGDWAEITERGGLVIHGRSDATLNPGGVRIGTAEIYRQVERVDEVVESLVIGQSYGDDVRIVLFVRLREGLELDDALRDR
ncbi:MAG: acetoacetate--CoA ligase, partial [Acidobacteriota bacterium]